MPIQDQFRLDDKVAVVAGGSGILGSAIAHGMAEAGAHVAVFGNDLLKAESIASAVQRVGVDSRAYSCNAMDRGSVEACCADIIDSWGRVDVLVNAVGGNLKDATTSPDLSFFDLHEDALSKVFNLNLLYGTIVPCQIFGKRMAELGNGGSIINISSMSAVQPLTRIPGYSAAKAAVDNFTQWLAVHLAQEYDPRLRVNAIAPGFFLTEQNRFLLTDPKTGEPTPRGKAIIDHTPMARYGTPDDLVGVALWLASDASRFVTGTVVRVDGGFSAYSGV